jgi:YidC/Oxa1 family membrane protein insertase
MNIWFSFLEQPITNALIGFYQLFGNMGLAIIGLTLALRILLVPLTLPGMKAADKMKKLAPKINKLKKKYKEDKQGFAKAQMELYRQSGVNPASGCLPQIVQIIILIALYRAFQTVLKPDGAEIISSINNILYPALKLPLETSLDLKFLYLDLSSPDLFKIPGLPSLPGIFLILAAASQFLSSKLMMPLAKKEEKVAKKTAKKSDDFATAFQTQSLYLFPLMTIFIGYTFPSGLVLYWMTFSVFTLVQQLLVKKYSEKS